MNFTYQVGDFNTCNKIEAIQQDLKTKKCIRFITPFESFDFSQDPAQSFKELLKQSLLRCRQDNDYIKFYYSGGIDSQLILESCIANGIKLDEIVCLRNGLGDCDYEIDQVAVPYLQKNKNNLNNAKVTIKTLNLNDYINHYREGIQDKQTSGLLAFHNYIRCHWSCDFYSKSYDPRVLHVRAMDKPTMCQEDGQWYVYFLDGDLEPHENNYQFFSNHPELIAKQCHTFINNQEHITNYPDLLARLKINCNDTLPIKETFFTDKEKFITYKGKKIRYQNKKEKIALEYCAENLTNIMDLWILYIEQLKHLLPTQWWQQGRPELGTVGVLSKFFCLTKNQTKTVDELYPNGFKPSKIATF